MQNLFHKEQNKNTNKTMLTKLESKLKEICKFRDDVLREQENLLSIKKATECNINMQMNSIHNERNNYLDIIAGYDGEFTSKSKIWKRNFEKERCYFDQRVDWKANRPIRGLKSLNKLS